MTTDPATERFELPIAVLSADIDQMDHVNNVVYLRWVQDVATAHWNSAATQVQQEAVAWVVVRHEIDYKYPARLGDRLIARTWVGGARKHLFERHTEIIRAEDSKLMAKARSVWCAIDARTGRPTRVGADVRERFSIGDSTLPLTGN